MTANYAQMLVVLLTLSNTPFSDVKEEYNERLKETHPERAAFTIQRNDTLRILTSVFAVSQGK